MRSCLSDLPLWGQLERDKVAPTLQVRVCGISAFLRTCQGPQALFLPTSWQTSRVTISRTTLVPATELKGRVEFGGVPEQKVTCSAVLSSPHPVKTPQVEGSCKNFRTFTVPLAHHSSHLSLTAEAERDPGRTRSVSTPEAAPLCIWEHDPFRTVVSSS